MATILRDIPYVSTPSPNALPHSQSLDLYLPPPPPLTSLPTRLPPLIIYIHGGLWMDRDKGDYPHIFQPLLALSLPLAVINYRLTPHSLTSPPLSHPSHTEDVAAAVQFLASPPSPYPYDPSRLILWGHSCGAHMAALLLSSPTLPPPPPILGCVGLQGMYDVEGYALAHPDWSADLYRVFAGGWDDPKGGGKGERGDVPWLVVHSTGDQWVEVSQAEGWVKKVREGGGSAELVVIEGGAGHWDVVQNIGKEGDAVTAHILRFIEALKSEGVRR